MGHISFVAGVLFKARYILPDASSQVLEESCIIVEGDRLSYVGPFSTSKELGPFEDTVDLGDCILLPGFVNAHAHAAMSLLRGVGNGLSLDDWLRKEVWPIEERLSEKDMVYGDLLSLVEFVRTGITSFLDFYNIRPMLQALKEVPLRATLSLAFLDLLPSMKEESWRRIEEVDSYLRLVRESGDLNGLALAPHSAYACSKEMLARIVEESSKRQLLVTAHVLESPFEWGEVERVHGLQTIQLLERLRLLNGRFLAVHCVHVDEGSMDALASNRSSVIHCPRSNSRLGVGVAPVAKMLRRGMNVALGTDGQGSSDSSDFFEEMRLAAYLQRSMNRDARTLSPRVLLAMATTNGCSALGLPSVGELAPGKRADFIAVRMDRPHLVPALDLIGNLVFASRPEDVRLTVVNGRTLCEDGRVLDVDVERLMREVQDIASSLA
jgi:5-methylthioadenosine/S-adenosylhomocysteine deaminase